MKECEEALFRCICESFDFIDKNELPKKHYPEVGIDTETFQVRFKEDDDEVIKC